MNIEINFLVETKTALETTPALFSETETIRDHLENVKRENGAVVVDVGLLDFIFDGLQDLGEGEKSFIEMRDKDDDRLIIKITRLRVR